MFILALNLYSANIFLIDFLVEPQHTFSMSIWIAKVRKTDGLSVAFSKYLL